MRAGRGQRDAQGLARIEQPRSGARQDGRPRRRSSRSGRCGPRPRPRSARRRGSSASGVPRTAASRSSKRLARSSVSGSSSANSSSTARVRSRPFSNCSRASTSWSSGLRRCSSPTASLYGLKQPLGDAGPAPEALGRPAGGGSQGCRARPRRARAARPAWRRGRRHPPCGTRRVRETAPGTRPRARRRSRRGRSDGRRAAGSRRRPPPPQPCRTLPGRSRARPPRRRAAAGGRDGDARTGR